MATYYSGTLYQNGFGHSGIKGQKWGVRRFQNLDRTWTEAGKERYGDKSSDNSGSKENKKPGIIKRFVKGRVDRFKDKHTWAMTDEELKERTQRLNMEASYRQARAENHSAAHKFVANLMMTAGTKLLTGAIDKHNAKALAAQQRKDAKKKHEQDMEQFEEKKKLEDKLRLDYEEKSGRAGNERAKDIESWRTENTKGLESWRNQNTRDLESWRNQNTRDLETWRNEHKYDNNYAREYANNSLKSLAKKAPTMSTEEYDRNLAFVERLYNISEGKASNKGSSNNGSGPKGPSKPAKTKGGKKFRPKP